MNHLLVEVPLVSHLIHIHSKGKSTIQASFIWGCVTESMLHVKYTNKRTWFCRASSLRMDWKYRNQLCSFLSLSPLLNKGWIPEDFRDEFGQRTSLGVGYQPSFAWFVGTESRLKTRPWTRKESMGLRSKGDVDWAVTFDSKFVINSGI